MAGRPDARNCFLDHVPEEVRTQHSRTLDGSAFFYPGLLATREDRSIFTGLREELTFAPAWLDNGMPFSRHLCLGSDRLLASSPTYREVISELSRAFRIEPVRSLVNLYRNGGDWCNLHSDQYDAGHCGINFTIGATFGEERLLFFEEKVRGDVQKAQISITQRNGDVHAFGEAVNERWRHGVPRCQKVQGERISIMLWGYRGEDSVFSDASLTLTGNFPHLLSYDPKSSKTPRVCEACDQTRSQLGGKVDLDHRWCCAQCWEAHDGLGWLPLPATEPHLVTDCLTIQGARLAVAILAGRKVVECRKSEFPAGWYALHVARRAIEPWESRRVEEEWPTAPKEQELPHEAIVGIVHLSPLPADQRLPEDCPWLRPGHCYIASKVVPLQRTLPARSPGSFADPWRLSPAGQRSVANLIVGQPVYENQPPTLVASTSSSVAAVASKPEEAGPSSAPAAGSSSWQQEKTPSAWGRGWYSWQPPAASSYSSQPAAQWPTGSAWQAGAGSWGANSDWLPHEETAPANWYSGSWAAGETWSAAPQGIDTANSVQASSWPSAATSGTATSAPTSSWRASTEIADSAQSRTPASSNTESLLEPACASETADVRENAVPWRPAENHNWRTSVATDSMDAVEAVEHRLSGSVAVTGNQAIDEAASPQTVFGVAHRVVGETSWWKASAQTTENGNVDRGRKLPVDPLAVVRDDQSEWDPWGAATDPWSMALEKGKGLSPTKKTADEGPPDVAWKFYRT